MLVKERTFILRQTEEKDLERVGETDKWGNG